MKPPTEEEKSMALALLNAFLLTNSPASLFRGLPSYDTKDQPPIPAQLDPADDSPIGKEARVVTQAKDCWALLAQDLIDTEGEGDDIEDDMDSNPLVGSYSWSTLSWMISIFERDEQLSQRAPSSNALPPNSNLPNSGPFVHIVVTNT